MRRRSSKVGFVLLCVVVVAVAFAVTGRAGRADALQGELLDFDTAYTVCRDRFLDESIADVWFVGTDAMTRHNLYRTQVNAGELSEDLYLDLMEASYGEAFARYVFYRETVVPSGGEPNCQALVDRNQSPPATTTTTTTAPPSIDPDVGTGDGIVWDDPAMQDAFEVCMTVVDWVANGEEGDYPSSHDWGTVNPMNPPGGIDEELWKEAVHYYELDVLDIDWSHDQLFVYQPKCHLLLPEAYTSRISIQYWTEAYSACLANVGTGDRSHQRPLHVPAWYWEVALAVGDCYLLLPLQAFGLGDGQDDQSWRSADGDEPDVPPQSEIAAVNTDYQHCVDFIGWRMAGGATWGGTGSLYDDPPEGSAPLRVWHEALNYYVDPTTLGEPTVPANWKPNCGLLLLYHPCQRDEDTLLPELCVGPHATANYDIGFSAYDNPEDDKRDSDGTPSVSRNLWGGLTGLVYQLGKHSVTVALWMVDWSQNFDISKYDVVALEIGDSYQDGLLGANQLHLRELFWLVLVAWAGFMAFRGRAAVAGAEIVLTVVLLLVSGVLLAEREVYMASVWNLMDEASATLLVAGTGGEPQENTDRAARQQLVQDTQRAIHRVFVEETYDHLNWGRSLGEADEPENPLRQCAAARYYILSMGPHGADPWPRERMTELGGAACGELVEFNRNPSGTRFMGGLLAMTSSILVAVLLGLVGLTIVIVKFVALMLFAVVPFVPPLMILPGGGRRIGWAWAATLMQAVTAVVMMNFLLSLLLITLMKLTELTGDISLVERFLLMNLVVFVVFAARRSVLSSGQRFAAHLREYMSATRGTGATWASTAASSSGGLDLLRVDRGIGVAAGAATVAAWNWHVARARSRYTAKLSYKNLQNVSKWKRGVNVRNARWVDGQINKQRLALPLEAPTRRQQLP